MSESALMNTYGTPAVTMIKGEGAFLTDSEGRRYLDALSGIAVCGLGYSHPAVTQALSEQAATLIHCSNLYGIEPQQKLGAALRDISGMDKVFFSNSGAEANEAAIKIARKFGQDKGITAPQVICTQRSFHGRTMATLSATGNSKIQTGFAPLVSGFVHVGYDSIEAIEAAANEHTVAVMVEPIQGEGGVRVPSDTYLNALRSLCDSKGWLLILDEIQTGNGRTGRYFAYQQAGILPDVVTTAKGLGNGVPIGACLAKGQAANVLQPGNHGSTFGGNPLATATALAVVSELRKPELLENAANQGERILGLLKQELASCAGVTDIRGRGLMIGVELDRDCGELVAQAREAGLLINVTAGNVVRLLPPLTITDDEATHIADTVTRLIKAFLSQAR